MKNDKKFDNLQSLDPSEKKEKTKRLKILKLPLHKKIKSAFRDTRAFRLLWLQCFDEASGKRLKYLAAKYPHSLHNSAAYNS